MMPIDLSHTPKRQTHLRNALWYGGFWLLLTLWLRLALPESMMGWERHQLFRFSADYLTFFSSQPYPVLFYLQAFFTQFFLYPLLGAAVISGLLALGTGAWHRLTGRFWTGLVWVAAMLPLLPYFNLLWVLFWLVVLSGGLLVKALAHARKGLWLPCTGLAGLGFLSLPLLQEQAVWAVLFWSLVYILEKRSVKNGLYAITALLSGGGIGLGLLLGAAYPHYCAPHLGSWTMLSQDIITWQGFPSVYFIPPAVVRLWIYIGGGLCLTLPLARLMPAKPFERRWTRIAGWAVVAALCLSAAYIPLRCQMEDFYKTDRLGGEGRWHEAAITAERAFLQRARPESLPRPTRPVFEENRQRNALSKCLSPRPVRAQNMFEESFLADMLKISLLADRKATSYLFAYNGSLHFPILFSEEILRYPSTYIIACYYASQGFYAEALHLFYDFVTSGRICPTVLEPILWNSVVVGDYAPCRKFIRLFEQSLFHRDIARRYTAYLADTAQTAKIPEIAAARQRLSAYDYTVWGYLPDNAIYSRLKYDGNNAAVYEYALCLWMVYKNHPRILAEWPKIRRFYPKSVPVHLQEAVLANYDPAGLENMPEDIDPAVATRYTDFCMAYDLYQKGYLPFETLTKDFKDTYWYHFAFAKIKTLEQLTSEGGGGKGANARQNR